MLKESDDLSWYARKAARRLAPAGAEPDAELARRLERLLGELKREGVRGDYESLTLYTRRLPPGCVPCLDGAGTNLYTTGLCTRDCFFCFNQKPRKDELVVHGIPIERPEGAAEIVERFGLESVGISGGEPLLFPERVLGIIAVLSRLPKRPRLDLYTNGDKLTPELASRLKDAGLDAIRFDLAARGYELSPVELALRFFSEVAVEIPAIPKELDRQLVMVAKLDELGVPFLNLHELFISPENAERMAREGYAAAERGHKHLLWRPVPESAEAALELLLFAARATTQLSVYFCSTGTQESISAKGLARRRVKTAAGPSAA